MTEGFEAAERRTKYSTCVPGVNKPSGRILVPSNVVVGDTGYPIGGYVDARAEHEAGSQQMFELLTGPLRSIT